MQKQRQKKAFSEKRNAFSLMELMIVIVILGLLSALVLPNIMGKAEDAKQKLVCIQMKTLKEALDSFKFDNGTYPDIEEGLNALTKNPDPEKYKNYARSGYLSEKNIPRDPWKNRYIYINEGGVLNLVSLGADGKEGGEGINKDITLESCSR